MKTSFFFSFLIHLKFLFLSKRARVRPIQLVGNEMQFVDTLEENIRNQNPIQNLTVQSCHVPFACLLNEHKSSIKDGLFFKLKVSDLNFGSFNLLVAWAVEIDSFYDEIEKPLSECFFNSNEKRFLQNFSLTINHENIKDLDR